MVTWAEHTCIFYYMAYLTKAQQSHFKQTPLKTHPVLRGVSQPSPNHDTVLSSVTWNVDHNANPNVTRSRRHPNLTTLPRPPCQLFTEFCENPLSSFCVILQTNKQTNKTTNITSRAEIINRLITSDTR